MDNKIVIFNINCCKLKFKIIITEFIQQLKMYEYKLRLINNNKFKVIN